MKKSITRHDMRFLVKAVAPIVLIPMFLGTTLLAEDRSFHNAPDSARALQNPYEGKPEAVQARKRLYWGNWPSCHGENSRRPGNVAAPFHAQPPALRDGRKFLLLPPRAKQKR